VLVEEVGELISVFFITVGTREDVDANRLKVPYPPSTAFSYPFLPLHASRSLFFPQSFLQLPSHLLLPGDGRRGGGRRRRRKGRGEEQQYRQGRENETKAGLKH
jgi:hypothetical protein